MYQKLTNYLEEVKKETASIDPERITILNEIIEYVTNNSNPRLNFICTHNSRRSHLSQIWAQTLAGKFNVPLETYSGGTEATAFNPNAVAALERAGFEIEKDGDANPRYRISFAESKNPILAFSKKYEDPPNPTTEFAAIMTCSEADSECPIVFGADKRIKLFYEDPKVADGTPQEAAKYDERCRQIATEMHYVFKSINSN